MEAYRNQIPVKIYFIIILYNHRKNEIYMDVIEKVNMLVSSTG